MDQDQHGAAARLGAEGPAADRQSASWTLEDAHLRRGFALQSHRSAACVRWPNQRQSFAAYVKQALVPTLHPGDVVILDNLGAHKGVAIRTMVRKTGARLLFLPPTTLISTPSNRSSPSSNTSCEMPPSGPLRRPGKGSARSCRPSPLRNAPTTSKTQVMLPYEWRMLSPGNPCRQPIATKATPNFSTPGSPQRVDDVAGTAASPTRPSAWGAFAPVLTAAPATGRFT
jgi:hypothetical protein